MSLSNYIKETRAELKHVSWPTRQQAIVYTVAVIVISIGLSLYLGLFDYLFSTGLKYLIGIY
jgi:preprotein translocase subunit SecE